MKQPIAFKREKIHLHIYIKLNLAELNLCSVGAASQWWSNEQMMVYFKLMLVKCSLMMAKCSLMMVKYSAMIMKWVY